MDQTVVGRRGIIMPASDVPVQPLPDPGLLRETLDLPEVSLVVILDADKEGFLRAERSLIQTIGRAARNINGKVILYGDIRSEAMQHLIDETHRRRQLQIDYNTVNNIDPKTILKSKEEIENLKYDLKQVAKRPRNTFLNIDKISKDLEIDIYSVDYYLKNIRNIING